MAQGQLGRNPWLCCRSPGPASQLPGPVGCWLGFVGKILQYCSATPEGTRDLGFPVWTAYLVRAWTVQCITAKCITAPTTARGLARIQTSVETTSVLWAGRVRVSFGNFYMCGC